MGRASLFLLAVVVFAAVSAVPGTTSDSGAETTVGEVARVRTHLDRAVRFLVTYEPSGLDASQARRRERIVKLVGDYRDRGVFPHNHGSETTALYFVDEHGTPCALASVILATGRADIVEAVRSRMNDAWVYQAMEDPELGPILADWLRENGLSIADAATIQVPSYTRRVVPEANQNLSTGYAVASSVSLGFSGVTTTLNLLNFGSAGPTPAWLGMVSGAVSVGIGVSAMDTGGWRRTVATVDVVGGLVAVATSAVRLIRGFDGHRGGSSTIAPEVRTSADGGAILGVRLRF